MNSVNNLQKLEQEVWAYCLTMANDPQKRYESRCDFYRQFGLTQEGQFGYGNSELAFMTWEMRGRLVANGGSPWWSAVNLRFIYYSELGARALEAGIPIPEMPQPSQLWALYIQNRTESQWYRAHNGSILAGFEEYKTLCVHEVASEQSFINIVLYRLLYAQSMADGWSDLDALGKILADPRGDAVYFMTHLSDYYPPDYPMTSAEYKAMFGAVHNLEEFSEEFFDDVVVGTEFKRLYSRAGNENLAPYLPDYLTDGKPSYPSGVPVYIGKMFWLIRIFRIFWKWLFP
ncbi:MAG: hypothetical protein HYX66_04380 [Ignavibacteria bacterium]|nr:hypothetical protein [Ignavibacteria bacterium]